MAKHPFVYGKIDVGDTMNHKPATALLLCLCLLLIAVQSRADSLDSEEDSQVGLQLERYEGFTHPSRELVLESYIDGKLEKINVRAGDRFQAGDVLAKLDDSIQGLAVQRARLQAESEAQIEAAEARVSEAEVELENQSELAERGSATQRDVRRARASFEVAQAELKLANEKQLLAVKQYEIERATLKLYTLRAPFDGEVLEVATGEGAEEGAALRQNDPIMHLAQLDPIVAKISLPERIVEQLDPGSLYAIRVGSTGTVAKANLKRIASVADRGSQLIEVEFEIPNPDGAIRSGVRCRMVSLKQAKND